MHASKYPHQPVLGFLLSKDEGTNTCTDVLGICHSNPTSFMLDLSSDIMSGYLYKSPTSSSNIIGVYYAPADAYDSAIPLFIEKIAQSIKAASGGCLILRLKSSLINSKDKLCVEAHDSSAGAECKLAGASIPDTNSVLDKLLGKEQQRLFTDVEEHTNDGSLDFRNSYLEQYL